MAEILAEFGFTVTGIDRSEAFLAMAREKATGRDLKIDYRQGDMWELDLDEKFDGAISLWSSIGYGSEEQDRRYFASLAKALGDDGVLVLDTQCLETLLTDFQEKGWFRAGEFLVAEERRFDPPTARVESEWTMSREGTFETVQSSLRIYSCRELIQMLEELGFGDFESYGSMELEPFEAQSSRLVLVARKV